MVINWHLWNAFASLLLHSNCYLSYEVTNESKSLEKYLHSNLFYEGGLQEVFTNKSAKFFGHACYLVCAYKFVVTNLGGEPHNL